MREPLSKQNLDALIHFVRSGVEHRIGGLIHIGSIFPGFLADKFRKDVFLTIGTFLSNLRELYDVGQDKDIAVEDDYVSTFVDTSSLAEYFDVPKDNPNYGVLQILSEKCYDIMEDMLADFYLSETFHTRKDIVFLLNTHKQYYEDQLKA